MEVFYSFFWVWLVVVVGIGEVKRMLAVIIGLLRGGVPRGGGSLIFPKVP